MYAEHDRPIPRGTVRINERRTEMRGSTAKTGRVRNFRGACLIMLLLVSLVMVNGCRETDGAAGSISKEGSSAPQSVEDALMPNGGDRLYLRISHDSGMYPGDSISVRIDAPDGFRIAYTTNGCVPGRGDDSGRSSVTVRLKAGEGGYLIGHRDQMVFPTDSTPILENADLPQGRVLCAALLDPSGEVVLRETRVYFFGEDFYTRFPGCLIVSVYADPDDLLDYDRGILVTGAVFDAWVKTEEAKEVLDSHRSWEYEANFTKSGKEWERPCLLQIYDGKSVPSVEQDAGIRIRGDMSRRVSQKSFNFYFRKEYGGRLCYELFDGIPEYKSFSMNAGGNNTEWLKCKEAFLKSLVTDRDLTMLSSRDAILFINGEYWGPYMLTEKLSDRMFEDHFGIGKDQAVVIKEGAIEVGGEEDISLYEELASFAEKDMSDPETYRRFCGIMDVQSMADYCAMRIYIGDSDWGWQKNDVLWRSRDASFRDGKWQYIPYDIEHSSGLYGESGASSHEIDHLTLATERYPLLASALKNEEFRALFMDTLKEVGAVNFGKERVEEELCGWDARWRPLMEDFFLRYALPRDRWDRSLSDTVLFFSRRYERIIAYAEEWNALH